MIPEISIQTLRLSVGRKTLDMSDDWGNLYLENRPKNKKWGMESTFCNFEMNIYAQP
jgi:hypothetical protein